MDNLNTVRKRYKPGQRFHYWELLEYVKSQKKWMARCICGKEKLVYIQHLTSGSSISCSCMTKHTHNMTGTRTYRSWSKMRDRCRNPKDDRYSSYGGRGITICEKWQEFENFLLDMGERPDGTSLDRIDVDGDYTPSNCRWATPKEQQNNLRKHKDLGLSCGLKDLAALHDIPYGRLQARVYRGWEIEAALNTPSIPGVKGYSNQREGYKPQGGSYVSVQDLV